MQSVGGSTKAFFFFDQNHLKALIGKTKGSIHACHPTTDNKGTFIDWNLFFVQLLEWCGTGNGHSDKSHGLIRCFFRGIGMDPWILIANIGHFKEIFVKPGGTEGIHKDAFMGFGCAGSNDNAVELMFFYQFLHLLLGILGAGKQVLSWINHIRQRFGIFLNFSDIYHTRNVYSAIAHKNTYPRIFGGYIYFLRQFHGFCQRIAGSGKVTSCQAGCRACFDDRTWNILGLLEYTAGIYTGSGCFNWFKRVRHCKIVLIQIHF